MLKPCNDFMKHYNKLVSFSLDKIERIDVQSAGTIQELRNQLNIFCNNCSTGAEIVLKTAGPRLLENKDIILNEKHREFLQLNLTEEYGENCPEEYKNVFELENAIKRGFECANKEERKTAFKHVRNMLSAYLNYLKEKTN